MLYYYYYYIIIKGVCIPSYRALPGLHPHNIQHFGSQYTSATRVGFITLAYIRRGKVPNPFPIIYHIIIIITMLYVDPEWNRERLSRRRSSASLSIVLLTYPHTHNVISRYVPGTVYKYYIFSYFKSRRVRETQSIKLSRDVFFFCLL